MAKRIDVEGLNAWFGAFQALADVSITVEPKQVTALIGPSGCGKSTFLRSLNRMHEVVAGAHVSGQVLLDDQDIYAEGVDRSLRQAGLWDEVAHRLSKPGGSLSGGQQQRLCIARAIAVEPEVLLMD